MAASVTMSSLAHSQAKEARQNQIRREQARRVGKAVNRNWALKNLEGLRRTNHIRIKKTRILLTKK